MDEDNLQESLDQLDAARQSGHPAKVLEALRELILDCEDERANLAYIEEMEKLALSLGDKQKVLNALSFRCSAYQYLEEWPKLRAAADAFQREARSYGDREEISIALLFLTEADLAEGELEQAGAHLSDAIELGSETTTSPVVDNVRAIRVLTLRQKLARAQGDLGTAQLLQVELEKLKALGQEILRRQTGGVPPNPPDARWSWFMLLAAVAGILVAYFDH